MYGRHADDSSRNLYCSSTDGESHFAVASTCPLNGAEPSVAGPLPTVSVFGGTPKANSTSKSLLRRRTYAKYTVFVSFTSTLAPGGTNGPEMSSALTLYLMIYAPRRTELS